MAVVSAGEAWVVTSSAEGWQRRFCVSWARSRVGGIGPSHFRGRDAVAAAPCTGPTAQNSSRPEHNPRNPHLEISSNGRDCGPPDSHINTDSTISRSSRHTFCVRGDNPTALEPVRLQRPVLRASPVLG